MKIINLLVMLSLTVFGIEQKQEGVGWLDIFSYDDASHKPRVLIIGDSIVRQYAGKVKSDINTKYTLTRLSTSKSICSPHYMKQLSVAMTQKYKLILVNNGLHDFHSSNKQYNKCFQDTIVFLEKVNPKSKIMLITTTGVKGNKERESIVIQRNQELQKLSQIFDLYAEVQGNQYLWKDAYHFKSGGINLLSNKITKSILEAK